MRLGSKTAVLLCVAFNSFAQSSQGPSPSQLCYYDVGKLASEEIIPCFEGSPISSCCMKASNCLADNACWDPASGATYQYGCTDSAYEDERCPWKCGFDTDASPWVGLVYCDGEGDTTSTHNPNNTWLCHHPDNCGGPKLCPKETVWPALPTKWPIVSCGQLNDPSATAFLDGNPLESIIVLPKDSKGVASYFSAHPFPTPPPSSPILSTSSFASTTPKVSSPSTLATLTTNPTSSPSSTWPVSGPTTGPDSSDSGHSSTLNIGLGAGIGIPVFFIVTGLLSFYGWRKHKRSKHSKITSQQDPPTPMIDTYAVGAAGSGFTHKAELDSTPINSPTMTTMGSGADNGPGKSVFEMESPQASPVAPVHRNFSQPPGEEVYEMEGDIPVRPAPQEMPSPLQPKRRID
ncbi:hypothetical protein BU16DRAFT_619463 [Lophium mytilinum]|uniref:Mid2 domain-containing protein n=1 Tax=Lophium mytilinum TaxID=390894 RepID=A0A6A6QRG7_9PEZI|nr:hypothetical protein BU16DRAFT_619463 [Lophium mytilinum]